MTIQKSEALVLKSVKFRDTSLITSFFTADFGKIKALSKGVRKERSSILSHYEPFSYVDITFYEKTKSDIHFLSECSLRCFFPKVRSDFEKISWASYLVELVEVVLPPHEENRYLFKLMLDLIRIMEEEPPSHLVAIFEVKLLLESGFFPNLSGCTKCGKTDIESYLSFSEGGLLCRTCWHHASNSLFVSKGLIRTIQFLADNELLKNLQLRMTREMEEEIHRFTYQWIYYRYEKSLAVVHFLREVDMIRSQ